IKVAIDTTRPLSLRLSAAAAVAQDKAQLDERVFDLMVTHCAAAETDAVTQMALARSLGGANLSAGQLDRLMKLVAGAGPLELPYLFRAVEEAPALPDGKELSQ